MSRMASSSSTMRTLGIGFGLRQPYPHGGPDALLGADRYRAAHPRHEILAYRQAQTKAAGGASARVEALEEVGEVLFGDASCPVLNGHRCSGDPHSHHPVGVRMLDGVGYGDQKCLLEQRRIGEDPYRWPFDAHADTRALGQGFRDLGRGMGYVRELDRLQLRLSPVPADAGEPE